MADDWWRGAVVYQIYPRSFLDTTGDGVGDLTGIRRGLAYVASLGVDAVWLSPFFKSPMKDFGYDVSDYRDVDPMFGTLAEFDTLVAEAHALGLKVIIDQVWSHSSDKHPWFAESSSSRDNPRADWYVWADPKPDGTAPNNWLSHFGGPSWTWGAKRRQYYLHNFLAEQPDLNFWNPDVQEAVLDIARFWMDRGVDGFRLDVVNYYVQDRALRDNPPAQLNRTPPLAFDMQRHEFNRSQPGNLDFIRRLRALLDGYGERMTVGEIGDDQPLERQQEYTLPPDRLQTAYSFYLLNGGAGTPGLFRTALDSWAGSPGWPSWSLGNHDIARFPTRMAHDDEHMTRALFAALICLRGTIFVYQGDELGLPDAHVPFDRLQDPWAIAAYAGGSGRDGCRTPMPWTSAAPMGGFTSAPDAWLPMDPAHLLLSVERQETLPGSMLHFSRAMMAVRGGSEALKTGESLDLATPEGVLGFERVVGDERVCCYFELAGAATAIAAELTGATPLLLEGGAVISASGLDLPPYAVAIVRR
ncbi:MAG TPA: alpha-amylase family glycosyl hydrolase [Caulobacteraceae bacterium]|jgi:alpha-glucosidase|nr:alpha-amylase family glycosyl hydrolase [Caulobacteraceae bacterium]